MKHLPRIGLISADKSEPGGFPRNIGDAALTDAIAQAVRKQGLAVDIADFGKPAPGSERSETRSGVNGLKGLFNFIRSKDVVCYGGGTLLQDDQHRALRGLPRLALLVGVMSYICRKPLIIWFVGAEHVNNSLARFLLTTCTRSAKYVYVREPESQSIVRSLLRTDSDVAADAVWLFDIHATPNPNQRRGLVVALNRGEVSALTSGQLQRWAAEYGEVRLLSMDQSENWDFKTLNPSGLPTGVTVEPPHANWPEVLETIRCAEALIASRMHALYFAALVDTPLVAVQSSAKVERFADEFGAPQCALDSNKRVVPQIADSRAVAAARQRALGCIDQVMQVINAST